MLPFINIFGCIFLAYPPYSTSAPSVLLSCCLCLGAAWLGGVAAEGGALFRLRRFPFGGNHRLAFGARSARPSRVPRVRGLRPRCGGAPPLPVGFVASRAPRACAPLCVSFCLACPSPFGSVTPPRPSSEGGADSPIVFCKTKSPTFSGKAIADTPSVKISFSARSCHGQCIHPCRGETRRVLSYHRVCLHYYCSIAEWICQEGYATFFRPWNFPQLQAVHRTRGEPLQSRATVQNLDFG